MLIDRWFGRRLFAEAESLEDPDSFGAGLEVNEPSSLESKMNASTGDEPAEATEPEEPEETQEEEEVISFADFLKSEGLDYEGSDALDLAKKVAADAKRAREAEFRANQLEQAQRYQEQQRAAQQPQQQAPAPQAPQPPEYFTQFMNRRSEFDQMKSLFARKPKTFDFSDRVTYDEQDNPIPRNPADYNAVREMNEAAQWLREYNSQVAANLPDFITYQVTHDPTIGYIINQAVRAAAQQNIQQYAEPIQIRDRAERLWMEYADKCYDDKEQLTPYGRVFVNAVQNLRKAGMDNPDQVFGIADDLAQKVGVPQAPAAGSSAEVKKAKAQLETIRKMSQKTANTAGSLPKGTRQTLPPTGERLTLAQKMLRQAGLE